MTLGVILGASFRVLRRNPGPVVGFSLVIHLILAVVNIAIATLFTIGALNDYIQALQSAETTGQVSQSTIANAVTAAIVASASGFLAQLFAYAANAILQGVITTEVARGTVGEKLPLSGLWARARGRVGALLGWAGLVILAVLVILGILIGIEVLLFALGGTGGAIAGGILAFVFFLGSIALGFWLSTKLSMVPSVLVIERLPLRDAIARSWSLTRGYFWRTLGIELLVAVMLAIAASIVALPFSLIVSVTTQLGNPTGLSHASAVVNPLNNLSEIINELIGAIIATVTAIVSTAATALIYIDLRIRKEGLDLQLMRFVDARAAGQTDVPDPYLTPESRTDSRGTDPTA
jgi:hypothetical protein